MPIVPIAMPSSPLDSSPRATTPPRPVRRGVTLLELLVVLILLAVTAAVVMPALRPPSTTVEADPAATVVASARRVAIRRGEPLRLRIASDGVWGLVTLHDGVVIDAGQLRKANPEPDNAQSGVNEIVLTIDALGSCHPADGSSNGATYDPLRCVWSNAVKPTAASPNSGAR